MGNFGIMRVSVSKICEFGALVLFRGLVPGLIRGGRVGGFDLCVHELTDTRIFMLRGRGKVVGGVVGVWEKGTGR